MLNPEAYYISGVGSCFPAGGLTWSEIIGAGSGPAGPAMDIHKCIYTAYQVKSRELTGQRSTYIVRTSKKVCASVEFRHTRDCLVPSHGLTILNLLPAPVYVCVSMQAKPTPPRGVWEHAPRYFF